MTSFLTIVIIQQLRVADEFSEFFISEVILYDYSFIDLTEILLEEILLEERDLLLTLSKLLTFLVMLMSITKPAGKCFIWEVVGMKVEGENCIFPKTLLGVTI